MRSVTCYANRGKRRGSRVLLAFAQGAGGEMVKDAPRLEPGPAAFYGINDQTAALQQQALDGRDVYYLDNGYFGRDLFWRATRGRLQHPGIGRTSRACPVPLEEWRPAGRHIVVALQKPDTYRLWGGISIGRFRRKTAASLAAVTDRPIVWRERDETRPLAADLADAWCLVTWTSLAAVTAICAGVPAIVLHPEHCARPMAGTSLADIEAPPRPEGREHWARVLASNQWTMEEMANGQCWRDLQAVAGDA